MNIKMHSTGFGFGNFVFLEKIKKGIDKRLFICYNKLR